MMRKATKLKHCVIFRCDKATLVFLKRGETMQTGNGFLIAKLDGWYCPKCAGSY